LAIFKTVFAVSKDTWILD